MGVCKLGIEETIKNIESIIGRKLTGEELIVIGIAFRQGYRQGYKQGGKSK